MSEHQTTGDVSTDNPPQTESFEAQAFRRLTSLENAMSRVMGELRELADQLKANTAADEQHREHTRAVLAKFFPFDEPTTDKLIPAGAPVVVPADTVNISEDAIVDKLFARIEAAAVRNYR